MDRVDTSEATNEPESGGNPGIWRLVALIALVLVGSVGWVILGAMDRQEAEQLVADAHAALDSGDTTTAATNVAKAEKKDPGRGDLVFAKGRLALAMDDQPLAQRLLRQSHERAKNEGWTLLMRAKLAVALAESEANSGDLVRALRVNDSGLARLVDVMDTHLDRDGLDPNAQPTDAEPMAEGVREGLTLLRQRGRLAAQRAQALQSQGDTKTAAAVLDSADQRVSATICTGTHRVYCRGIRATLRETVLAPTRTARTRLRIAGALALVKKQRFDEALEVATEAHEQAAAEAKKAGQGKPGAAAEAMAREAISVEYAVRVAMGQQLEGQRKWGDALEQFKEAASLWKKGRLAQNGPQPSVANEGGQPPHVAGLTRARTLHKLLDETDSTLDKAAKLLEPIGADLGIGNTARKRFHDKLKAAPLDPKIYAEEALTRIRTARVANSDTTELQKVQAQAKRFLDASEKVVPGDPMGRFYKGVLAFMAGYPKKGLDGMRAAYKAGYKGRAAELYLAETLSLRDKHAEALTHWKKAWQAETADTYVGRRMVEALVARGELKAARELLARMLEERTPDRDLIEAQVLVHLHTKNYDALRQVLLLDRTQFTANAPAEIERTRRITTAVYNKLGKARVNGEIMKPGEEMVDRLYGYAIPVDGLKVTAEKRVQSAILVLTTQGLIVLRWDTSKDYRKEIETGARLAKRAVRVGVKLSGEFAGLHLGDGIGKLVQLLDLLPESKPREKTKKESLLDSTVGLAIDSLDLFDSLRGDLELQVAGKDIKAHRIGRGTVVAWELLPVDPSKGLYAVHARTRDGVSPWRTDTDRLLVHTDRPARLRMYLQHVLQAKK